MMKTIENKVTSLNKNETEKMGYFDLLIFCLDKAPQGQGLTSSENRKRNKVAAILEDAIDKKVKIANIEDADYEVLVNAFDQMVWGARIKELDALEDHLKGVKAK